MDGALLSRQVSTSRVEGSVKETTSFPAQELKGINDNPFTNKANPGRMEDKRSGKTSLI